MTEQTLSYTLMSPTESGRYYTDTFYVPKGDRVTFDHSVLRHIKANGYVECYPMWRVMSISQVKS